MEVWSCLIDYPNYSISNLGNIKNSRGRMMKQRKRKDGYLDIKLSKNGKYKTMTIHRLILMAFVPNINHYPEADHKNRDKLDNRLVNLHWCNRSQNCINKKVYGKIKEKNIGMSRNNYRIQIRRNKIRVFDKTCKTIEEAIICRDEWLRNNK